VLRAASDYIRSAAKAEAAAGTAVVRKVVTSRPYRRLGNAGQIGYAAAGRHQRETKTLAKEWVATR